MASKFHGVIIRQIRIKLLFGASKAGFEPVNLAFPAQVSIACVSKYGLKGTSINSAFAIDHILMSYTLAHSHFLSQTDEFGVWIRAVTAYIC